MAWALQGSFFPLRFNHFCLIRLALRAVIRHSELPPPDSRAYAIPPTPFHLWTLLGPLLGLSYFFVDLLGRPISFSLSLYLSLSISLSVCVSRGACDVQQSSRCAM